MQNITKRDIANIETQQYRVVKTSTPSPFKIPTKFTRKHRKHSHTLYIAACEVIYAVIAIALGGIAYHYLAAYPVYRVVALAVIVITWSTFAASAWRRKSIDMMETVEHPALRIWSQRQRKHQKALYTEETNVFLKAVKASFVDH
jgi:hypothetical protein